MNESLTPESVKKTGWYDIVIRDARGFIREGRIIHNLITNAGFAGLASRTNGSGGAAAFTYIALGTGTTPAAVTDTALQTELASSGLSRVNATASLVTTSVTNDTSQLQNTFAVTGSQTITEAGILNAASVGTLLSHQVFTGIPVINTDNIQITYKVQNS